MTSDRCACSISNIPDPLLLLQVERCSPAPRSSEIARSGRGHVATAFSWSPTLPHHEHEASASGSWPIEASRLWADHIRVSGLPELPELLSELLPWAWMTERFRTLR